MGVSRNRAPFSEKRKRIKFGAKLSLSSRAASLGGLGPDAPPDRPAVQGLPIEQREHVELRRGHHGAGPAAAEAAAAAAAVAAMLLAREV